MAKQSAGPLSLERLKEVLHYDADARVFYWRADRGKNKAGSVAGSVQTDGYSRIMIDHKGYSVSRLAHFYEHGEWPSKSGDLTQDLLKRLFEYDPETGFFWHRTVKDDSERTRRAGAIAGGGYRYIKINHKSYLAQRLAFLYMIGRWPSRHVDHRDRDRDNNAWRNLREATRRQNSGNQAARVNNKLGVKGVHRVRNGYRAVVARKHLGTFATIEEASAAYEAGAKKYFGEFARSS
jgi:hypothetical protein